MMRAHQLRTVCQCLLILPLLSAAAYAGTSNGASSWDLLAAPSLWETDAGTLQWRERPDGSVLRWTLDAGRQGHLRISMPTAMRRVRDFDHIRFRFRLVEGQISDLNLQALGHVTGLRRGKVHDWGVATRTTAMAVPHERWFEFSRPGWLPWDIADGPGAREFLRFQALALAPDTVIEFDRITLSRADLLLKPDWLTPITWPALSTTETGFRYTLTWVLANYAGAPADLHARIVSDHAAFEPRFVAAVAGDPRRATTRANHGGQARFTLEADLSRATAATLDTLYAEPLLIEFFLADNPAAAILWQGVLVRPLGPEIKTQVVLSDAELAAIRDGLAAQPAETERWLGMRAIIATADTFLEKELLDLPGHNQHVANNYPGHWRPGVRMPEAVNLQTGETQFNTPTAARTWKEYLANRGRALEHLGTAYLVTQDARYAQKAVELLRLYAERFETLTFGSIFEIGWLAGQPMLASSRIAASSSYGSNWYLKGLALMLSAISDAETLTDDDRDRLRRGFLHAYATEILKFPAGISNMSDITHHNLVLMGLAMRDATMVYYGLYRDAGLIRRLDDLSDDGFSSEGRPLNYHYAAMSEFLPALAYVERSGLRLDWPRGRLAAALRMPYQRAALNGIVPNAGDVGRGMRVGAAAVNQTALPIFPETDWLRRMVSGGGFQGGVHRLLYPDWQPAADGWRTLLETGPRLFPDAGLGILRQGESAGDQIMATLDYGSSPMHAHRDRNTVSLMAFGHMFSQGPGTLYNIGRGGMTTSDDPRLNSFIGSGSLGQNVILVDTANQRPAIGRLLHWDAGDAHQTIAAAVPGIAPGVEHRRQLMLEDGIVVLMDRIQAEEGEHRFDFVYRNIGAIEIGDGWTATACGPLGETANYPNLIDPRRLQGDGPIHLRWQVADRAHLALWQLPRGNAYVAVTGMNNLETARMPEPAPALIHRVDDARAAWFVTVLEPYRETPRITAVEAVGEHGVRALVDGQWRTWRGDALLQ